MMSKYNLEALPIVDSLKRLIGLVTIDDVIDFVKEEADRDYQLLSGISENVESTDKVWVLSRARLPCIAPCIDERPPTYGNCHNQDRLRCLSNRHFNAGSKLLGQEQMVIRVLVRTCTLGEFQYRDQRHRTGRRRSH